MLHEDSLQVPASHCAMPNPAHATEFAQPNETPVANATATIGAARAIRPRRNPIPAVENLMCLLLSCQSRFWVEPEARLSFPGRSYPGRVVSTRCHRRAAVRPQTAGHA